jgi:hypothetical protein
MAIDNIVALLLAERDRLNRAIEALQGSTKRRGRPPGSGSKAAAVVTASHAGPAKAAAPARKQRNLSPAQRKAASERMKAYWAAKRKQKGK